MNTLRTIVIFGLLAAVHAPCGVAFAAPGSSKVAAAAIEAGYNLRLEGKHAEALKEFERAYQLEPSGKALAMMALTEQELGRWIEAEEHGKAALASSDSYVKKNRRYIEGALKTIGEHIGELTVSGADEGSLSIDRGMAVPLPLEEPVRLGEGKHALLVTRSGFFPWEGEVTIEGGKTHEVRVAMLPERPLPQLDEIDAAASVPLANKSEEPPAAGAPHRKAGWGIVAGSAAVAIFGATLWGVDGNSIDEGKEANTKGGPLLLGLGVAGLIAGGLLISGAF